VTEQQERVERFSRELREGPPPSDRSIKEVLDALRPQLQELVNGGGLAGAGAGRLRGLDPKPRRTMAALQQNIDWLKGQLRS
jgi:hypothetical protein